MLEGTAASASSVGVVELPLTLPTRIITCAWGDRYLQELLTITLPALLAPGNLPYVASVVPCELVILTEQASFSRVLNDVTVRRIRELCGLRLVEIDDLIPSPDQYGMAITYALHRGFSDLGPTATDTWLIFLNADFVLAEGSLRSVIRHLAEGQRLVAAPSYCVKAGAATPELLRHLDPRSRALSISPREMAALVLRHRHDSVRGKTVNQAVISMRYMDQFYWLVDPDTMLGHQMPVAIVGMRPERNLPEPNSFWDYGLIREFCPTAEHFVLRDSDDFLMLELRQRDVRDEEIVSGWPEPKEIARRMILFVTPYTKDMARHSLTLHAADLPPGLDEARANLRAFVDRVLASLPEFLPSHLEHPQFEYHWPTFMESRHRYLSTRLGSATETEEPPLSLSELDRAWWKLDGLTKAYVYRRNELISLGDQQRGVIGGLRGRLEKVVQEQRAAADERLARSLGAIPPGEHPKPPEFSRTVYLSPNDTTAYTWALSEGNESAWAKPILDDLEEWSRVARDVKDKRDTLMKASEFLEKHYREAIQTLDSEFEINRQQLQADYERLLKRRTRSAAIPDVVMRQGPRASVPAASGPVLVTTARWLYRCCYGTLPRVQKTHPYWAAMRHLIRLIDTAAQNGVANVLIVTASGGVADSVADPLPGLHAQVSLAEFTDGNFSKAFQWPIKFDLCICTLGPSDLSRFHDLAHAAAPYMNRGGKILALYPNFGLRSFSNDEIALLRKALDLPWSVRLHYAGSARSARVVRRFQAAMAAAASGRLKRLLRIATTLLVMAPATLAANRAEAAASGPQSSRLPEECTSVTIEVIF
jgi:hypothetical protein